MTQASNKGPCDLCKAQVKKSRHDPPHDHLKELDRSKPYRHMFGGGEDSRWRCNVCGTEIFHSTDKYDFGWQIEHTRSSASDE